MSPCRGCPRVRPGCPRAAASCFPAPRMTVETFGLARHHSSARCVRGKTCLVGERAQLAHLGAQLAWPSSLSKRSAPATRSRAGSCGCHPGCRRCICRSADRKPAATRWSCRDRWAVDARVFVLDLSRRKICIGLLHGRRREVARERSRRLRDLLGAPFRRPPVEDVALRIRSLMARTVSSMGVFGSGR